MVHTTYFFQYFIFYLFSKQDLHDLYTQPSIADALIFAFRIEGKHNECLQNYTEDSVPKAASWKTKSYTRS